MTSIAAAHHPRWVAQAFGQGLSQLVVVEDEGARLDEVEPNRDPEVFGAPQRFDVQRENAREHLSFSGGRHFCSALRWPGSRARWGCSRCSTASRT